MIDSTQLEALVTAAQSIAAVLTQLGVPGLLTLALSGPALVIIAMLFFEHLRTKRSDEIMQAHSAETARILSSYRDDSLKMIRELGDNQSVTDKYYRDNVELVKNYERMAKDLSDVITNCIGALQRMSVLTENNMQCPMAREAARGRM